MITLGVLADTHIPDRTKHLHPDILPLFREARVQAILHTGDVCIPQILAELSQVAPVHAVRGNRDWIRLRRLPMSLELEYEGVRIGMAHGHGNLKRYLGEKVDQIIQGYHIGLYLGFLLATFPNADAILFGHTHNSFKEWIGGKLFFNPGSASVQDQFGGPAKIGLLRLGGGEKISTELISLS